MREVRELGQGSRYHLVTYGCQMNAHDSEHLAGMLERMGYAPTEAIEEADVVLFNTCCVRENAEKRVYGNIGALKALKQRRPDVILGVCGCMMQQSGAAEALVKRFPFVDVAFGTHNLYALPELISRAVASQRAIVAVAEGDGRIAAPLPVRRALGPAAFLTIMYGCDNFCSYCIVPHVRGRERSRSLDEIRAEADELRGAGTREITLLGQNVNSYGLDLPGRPTFPGLLRALDGAGFDRIRFMTSHPKDASDELFAAMRACKSVCPQLHLPVQSGSDRVLAAMNRKYTRDQYLERIASARRAVEGLGVTTDFIVGFPGETDAEFEDTLSLVRAARFDAAYTFKFSPRRGTAAAELAERVPAAVSKERLTRLIQTQAEVGGEIMGELVGRTEPVLIESAAARGAGVTGRTPRGTQVNFPGDGAEIGSIVQVRLTEVARNTMRGVRAE